MQLRGTRLMAVSQGGGREGWVPGMVSQHDYRYLTYSDTGGTTPISSGSVAAWGDLITGQLHTQGTGTAQPTLGAGGLSFDGGDSLLLSSPTGYPTGNVPVTMYTFFAGSSGVVTAWGTNSANALIGCQVQSSTNIRLNVPTNDIDVTTPTNTNVLIAAVYRYSSAPSHVGNAFGGSTFATPAAKSWGNTTSILGAYFAGINFTGIILGRIIYPVFHNAAQVNQNLREGLRQYGAPYYPVSA